MTSLDWKISQSFSLESSRTTFGFTHPCDATFCLLRLYIRTFLFIFRIGKKVSAEMLSSSFSGRLFPVNSSGVSCCSVLMLKAAPSSPGGGAVSTGARDDFTVWEVDESCLHICLHPEALFLDPSLLMWSLSSSSSLWQEEIISARWRSSLCLCLRTEETPQFDLKNW